MKRRAPLCLLYLDVYWHLNISCKVKWGDALSEEFLIPLGTKQGGISSPKFFALYVDEIAEKLRQSGLGCHLVNVFVGAILFADDLALLSPSRAALQKMIHLCHQVCNDLCLQFNSKKSKILVFGKCHKESLAPICIGDTPLEYVQEWKYLGTTLVSGRNISFSARSDLSSFLRATNSIIAALPDASEHVVVQLLYCNCVPILSYASEVKQFSASEMTSCNTAINNAMRRVFGFTDWRSIRALREVFGFQSIYEIFKKSELRFLASCQTHVNPIIRHLINHVLTRFRSF